MFLEVLVDSELTVVLLPILPVRSLDVGLALEHHDEGADADLKIGKVDKLISYIEFHNTETSHFDIIKM